MRIAVIKLLIYIPINIIIWFIKTVGVYQVKTKHYMKYIFIFPKLFLTITLISAFKQYDISGTIRSNILIFSYINNFKKKYFLNN